MKLLRRWPVLIAGLAVVFVAGAAIANAVRQGSWAPITSAAWIPAVLAVLAASAGGRYGRCRPRRGGRVR
jgi:hypothetical protein